MAIKNLHLQQFRNYRDLKLSIEEGITVFTGHNGIGKTTILEAISLLGSGKSFRNAKNADFIKKNQEGAFVTGDINTQGLETQIKIKIYPQGKKVFLDEKLAKSTQPLFQLIPTITFSPADHKIIEGDSSDRKHFLNRAASNLDWEYAEDLAAYNKVLLQRNRILKDSSREHWSFSRISDLLQVWDQQLVSVGSKLIRKRMEFIQKLLPKIHAEYQRISGSGESFSLDYEIFGHENTKYPHNEVDKIFEKELKDSVRRDMALESTQVGPHKDEILLTLDGNKVKFYGSQGEKRTCALALRLGELALFREKMQRMPVLLFDDVSSELDQSRRHSLVELLQQENTQVLITATELPTTLMGSVGKSFKHMDLENLGDRT